MNKCKKIFFFLFLEIFLSSCSVNLVKSPSWNSQNENTDFNLFKQIPLIFNGDTLWLEKNLIQSYNSSISNAIYPQDKCFGVASIKASVLQNSIPSNFSIPIAFIPFWPVLPVNETWTFQLDMNLYCENTLVKHLNFIEEETIKATIYGKLRSDLLNNAIQSMHKKLLNRVFFELNYSDNADLNSQSDY